MTKLLLFVFVIYCLSKISHAKPTDQLWPAPTPPTANNPRLTPTPTLDGPKCYPQTAIAYFLPAPPSSPKITILDPKNYKEGKIKANIPELISTVKAIPATQEIPQKSCDGQITGSIFPPPPPPPCSTGLPDLIDKIPSLMKDRFSRLTEDKPCACESCASLLKKLPIFNFDQELLDGFLAGIKL